MSKQELIYKGSVKNLWKVSSDLVEFEFTDAFSVFDWGKMPDTLNGKGKALATMAEFFFKNLSNPEIWKKVSNTKLFQKTCEHFEGFENEFVFMQEKGVSHHFHRRTAENKILVSKVESLAPKFFEFAGNALYSYPTFNPIQYPQLIPLEVVFRLGVPQGSSYVKRNPNVKEGTKLELPVVEFFTKLEPIDRYLSWEQALNYSGLSETAFRRLVLKTLGVALWLNTIFDQSGVELWDGKLEWALLPNRQDIMLVDAIGPDELRLIEPETQVQVSKELLRLYYRSTSWFQVLEKEKKAGSGWKQRVLESKGEPPELPSDLKNLTEQLYLHLAEIVTEKKTKKPEIFERMNTCLNKLTKSE